MLSRASWRLVLASLVLVTITVWSAFVFADDGRIHAYFFDVGQGDSILIKQGNYELLVDGGPDGKILQHLGRTLPPWDRTIEVVVLTHPHADHVTGLTEVLKRYQVGEVWGTGTVHTSEIYVSFLRSIKDQRIPYRVVRAGDSFDLPDARAEILHPLEDLTGVRLENANDSSIVMRITRGHFSMLLTGDLEEGRQQAILERGMDPASTVLKIPHQGSRDADLPAFLGRVRPMLTILSVGKKNQFGHPHAEVLAHYQSLNIPILRTDQDGTVHLTSDGKTVWIKTAKTGTMARVELAQ